MTSFKLVVAIAALLLSGCSVTIDPVIDEYYGLRVTITPAQFLTPEDRDEPARLVGPGALYSTQPTTTDDEE